MAEAMRDEVWPTKFLSEELDASELRAALLILNSPLHDAGLVQALWRHASFIVCADGGANRLRDLEERQSCTNEGLLDRVGRPLLPDLIHGDLDSLRDDVRCHYAQQGVEISKDPDQDSTDFGKAIAQVVEHVPEVRDILILGSVGGRVDQGIGLLHEMYRAQHNWRAQVRFWLFSESSITFLMRRGATTIHTPLREGFITKHVGVLPMFGIARITTKGLEWNVEDWQTQMGYNISTSNHIVADTVEVTTNVEVLFTVERATRKAKADPNPLRQRPNGT